MTQSGPRPLGPLRIPSSWSRWGYRAAPLRGASLGPADGSHFPATFAATEEPIATVRLQPRHTYSRWHIESFLDLTRVRIDAPQVAFIAFGSGVPELRVDPSDSRDKAIGFDS